MFNLVPNLEATKAETLVLFVDANLEVAHAEALTADNRAELQKLLELDSFKGSAGQVSTFTYPRTFKQQRLLVVGLGKTPLQVKVVKKVVEALVATLTRVKAKHLALLLPETLVEGERPAYRTARVVVEAVNQARYQFKRYLTLDRSEDQHSDECSCCTGVKTYDFVSDNEHSADFAAGLEDGRAVSAGIKLARDCGNLPPNVATPKYLSEVGEKLARDYEKVKVEVVDEFEMEKLGFGCYLAVGRGSVNRPYMTVLRYEGAPDASEKPYVFVGKGMTFDTGGYSIKPAASMEEMKYDMCGGAAVLGLIKAVAELELPVNVVGVVAGCENMISSTAYRPGDILTSASGLTVEVNNTDAEGRLVLADALNYVQRFNPELVVDIATLTGAILIALGNRTTGLFTEDDELATELTQAGEYVNDTAWRMPLDEDYRKDVRGNHADITNSAGRLGGSCTAAAFLSYFAKGYRWAHLDVAGTAWRSGGKHLASGRPVSQLATFLQTQVAKKAR